MQGKILQHVGLIVGCIVASVWHLIGAFLPSPPWFKSKAGGKFNTHYLHRPAHKITAFGWKKWWLLSHNHNTLFFLKNSLASRPDSICDHGSCSVSWHAGGKKRRCVSTFLCAHLNNGTKVKQPQTEGKTITEQKWKCEIRQMIFFFFLSSEMLGDCGRQEENRQAVCRTGDFWRWSPIGVFWDSYI